MSALPPCPNCGADELYCKVSHRDGHIPTLSDYLAAPIGCYLCRWQSDAPAAWIRENDNTWWVRIPAALQNTAAGRMDAVRRLPRDVYRHDIYWRDERNVGSYRWWCFSTHWPALPRKRNTHA